MSEIVNRVKQSNLKQIDPEDIYPTGKRLSIDITPWLWQQQVVREKDFRNHIDRHNWEQYKDAYVAVYCPVKDAIIPSWAYMLISSRLAPYARKSFVTTPETMELLLIDEAIAKFDPEPYRDKPVIIKGCGKYPIPPHAYLKLVEKLQKTASRISFGEPCSAVPVWRRKS